MTTAPLTPEQLAETREMVSNLTNAEFREVTNWMNARGRVPTIEEMHQIKAKAARRGW